jgi:hypothetical protein
MATLFGASFLDDHVGHIKSDPVVALIELIANSSDAGATQVDITWPSEIGQTVAITDNGIGMTEDELLVRWQTLSFDRRRNIGKEVVFPLEVEPKPQRSLFGKSGKGRHAAFCFAPEYALETWRSDSLTIATVTETKTAQTPFSVLVVGKDQRVGHGTRLSAKLTRNLIPEQTVLDAIGSKFLIDPSFKISVNNQPVNLTAINGIKEENISLTDGRKIQVIIADSEGAERNNRLRGIAWWVNNRLVGAPSWKSIVGGPDYLDGRSNPAKRFAFVVKADVLDQFVKEDWTEFRQSDLTTEVMNKVDVFVGKTLMDLQADTRKDRKIVVIEENRVVISELSPSGRFMVGAFVDEVQRTCPSMKQDDMANAVQVLAKLEQARSGYGLLHQLAVCSTEDLDRWESIIRKWDARQAQIVLDEIEKRIRLIFEMRRLVNEKTTDELHELQPLFEQGLWIFGPQYETVEFVANRSLKTIVEKFLGGRQERLAEPRTRPDFVTSPVGVWDSSHFDYEGNVVGSEKVLILELKRGGFHIRQPEVDQARDYGLELRRAGSVQPQTRVECIVMGSTLEPLVSEQVITEQLLRVSPRTYDTVLRQADLRLFNLRKRIEELGTKLPTDPEIDQVLRVGVQQEFSAN